MALSGTTAPRRFWLKRLFLPRSLLGRVLLIMVTPVILMQAITVWVFYDRHWDTITRRLALGIAGDIVTAVELLQRSETQDQIEDVFRLARWSMKLDLALLGDRPLPTPPEPWVISLLDRKLTWALEDRLSYPFAVDSDAGPDLVEIHVKLADDLLRVRVDRGRLFSSTTYLFIAWMIGTSVLLFGVAIVFMRGEVHPIRRLALAADSFGKGRDVPNFRPEGAKEVRLAAAAFLQMRARIKRQMRQRTEMLAGVSHDLRTPITRMKLELAMLGDSPEAENLTSDLVEMERMVEGYLAFARGEGTEEARETDLSELLRDIVAQAQRAGSRIETEITDGLVLPLRPEAMRRCFSNLINNAQRYAEKVRVSAAPGFQAIEITIDDDGPGIPEAEREDVFKPFYRREASRNPTTGGVGLGLTIARDVVRSHGGELSLGDSELGGLRAYVRLPV
ncbi:MAG: ATP-binding protein [Kiloniellales bacterium]|nr:ATP-binding protein [Kiloniellales bacterium]